MLRKMIAGLIGIKLTFGLDDAISVLEEIGKNPGVDKRTAMAAVNCTVKIAGLENVVAPEHAAKVAEVQSTVKSAEGSIKSYRSMITAEEAKIARAQAEQAVCDEAVAFVTGKGAFASAAA